MEVWFRSFSFLNGWFVGSSRSSSVVYFPSILVDTWVPLAGWTAPEVQGSTSSAASGITGLQARGRKKVERFLVHRMASLKGGLHPPSNISISLIFLRNWCNSCNSKNCDMQLGHPPEKKLSQTQMLHASDVFIYTLGPQNHEKWRF